MSGRADRAVLRPPGASKVHHGVGGNNGPGGGRYRGRYPADFEGGRVEAPVNMFLTHQYNQLHSQQYQYNQHPQQQYNNQRHIHYNHQRSEQGRGAGSDHRGSLQRGLSDPGGVNRPAVSYVVRTIAELAQSKGADDQGDLVERVETGNVENIGSVDVNMDGTDQDVERVKAIKSGVLNDMASDLQGNGDQCSDDAPSRSSEEFGEPDELSGSEKISGNGKHMPDDNTYIEQEHSESRENPSGNTFIEQGQGDSGEKSSGNTIMDQGQDDPRGKSDSNTVMEHGQSDPGGKLDGNTFMEQRSISIESQRDDETIVASTTATRQTSANNSVRSEGAGQQHVSPPGVNAQSSTVPHYDNHTRSSHQRPGRSPAGGVRFNHHNQHPRNQRFHMNPLHLGQGGRHIPPSVPPPPLHGPPLNPHIMQQLHMNNMQMPLNAVRTPQPNVSLKQSNQMPPQQSYQQTSHVQIPTSQMPPQSHSNSQQLAINQLQALALTPGKQEHMMAGRMMAPTTHVSSTPQSNVPQHPPPHQLLHTLRHSINVTPTTSGRSTTQSPAHHRSDGRKDTLGHDRRKNNGGSSTAQSERSDVVQPVSVVAMPKPEQFRAVRFATPLGGDRNVAVLPAGGSGVGTPTGLGPSYGLIVNPQSVFRGASPHPAQQMLIPVNVLNSPHPSQLSIPPPGSDPTSSGGVPVNGDIYHSSSMMNGHIPGGTVVVDPTSGRPYMISMAPNVPGVMSVLPAGVRLINPGMMYHASLPPNIISSRPIEGSPYHLTAISHQNALPSVFTSAVTSSEVYMTDSVGDKKPAAGSNASDSNRVSPEQFYSRASAVQQQQQLVSAHQQLVPGQLQLVPGYRQLVPGQQQLVPGQQQLIHGYQQLVPGQQQLVPGQQQHLAAGQQQQMIPGQQQQLAAGQQQQLMPGQQLIHGQQQMAPGHQQQLVPGQQQQLVPGQQQLVPGLQQLIPGQQQLMPGQQQLVVSVHSQRILGHQQQMLVAGHQQQLVSTYQQLMPGQQQHVSGHQQLIHGQQQKVSDQLQQLPTNLIPLDAVSPHQLPFVQQTTGHQIFGQQPPTLRPQQTLNQQTSGQKQTSVQPQQAAGQQTLGRLQQASGQQQQAVVSQQMLQGVVDDSEHKKSDDVMYSAPQTELKSTPHIITSTQSSTDAGSTSLQPSTDAESSSSQPSTTSTAQRGRGEEIVGTSAVTMLDQPASTRAASSRPAVVSQEYMKLVNQSWKEIQEQQRKCSVSNQAPVYYEGRDTRSYPSKDTNDFKPLDLDAWFSSRQHDKAHQ